MSNKCLGCAAQIRPNAVFCHHCGRPIPAAQIAHAAPVRAAQTGDLQPEKAVIVEKPSLEPLPEQKPNSNSSNGSITDSLEMSGTAKSEIITVEPETAAPVAPPNNEKTGEKIAAPSIRRTKRYVRQTEYIWEPSDAPVWQILLFALLILAAVAALIYISIMLR